MTKLIKLTLEQYTSSYARIVSTVNTTRSTLVEASFIAQSVKNLPAMQETQVQFLGPEDPVEKEIATHSSNRAWKIPQTEEPGRLQSKGL